MTITRMRGMLITLAVVAAVLPATLIGCSGSASSSPGSGTTSPAPAVVITGTSSTVATGPVTLTFTFSQPMSAFPASDVTVTNGAAAASTTRVNANQYTLVVTPTANDASTMQISVAAGAFTDAAGVANTAAASVTQAYNTVVTATPPTVAISGTSGTAVNGPFTLTFTFSKDVGTSFTAGDVVLNVGTAAATATRVDATHYTLVVTPPASGSGTINISVPVGSFQDSGSNLNTAAASASQTYDMSVAATSYAVVDFNTSGLTYLASDFGGAATTLDFPTPPAGGPSTPVARVIKTSGANTWAGTTFSVGYADSVGTMPFTASHTKLTAVVYSPASIDWKLKVEDANDPTHTVETETVTAAAGWQTLTFDMANQSTGTAALNPAYTFNKVDIFPDWNVSPSADLTYYVGPITFLGASGPSAPPLPTPSGGSPATGAAAPTLTAGSYIMLWDSSNAYVPITVGNWNPNWGQSGSIAPFTAGSASIWKMNLIGYQGVDISGPDGNATDTNPAPISIAGKTTLHISYWTADGTAFTIIPIDANDTQESNPIASGTLTQNAWTDLNLSFNGAGFDPTTLRQLKFVTSAAENIYMDNIYFH